MGSWCCRVQEQRRMDLCWGKLGRAQARFTVLVTDLMHLTMSQWFGWGFKVTKTDRQS